jgi:hypothetical protein
VVSHTPPLIHLLRIAPLSLCVKGQGSRGPYAQVKVTGKAAPVHAMKAFRETRGMTQLAHGGAVG